MSNRQHFARMLAAAMLAGPAERLSIRHRLWRTCGGRQRWLTTLASRAHRWITSQPQPVAVDALAEWVGKSRSFTKAWNLAGKEGGLVIREVLWPTPQMQPAVRPWPVPALATLPEVAAWLKISRKELDWFALAYGHAEFDETGKLLNYLYRWVKKAGRAKPAAARTAPLPPPPPTKRGFWDRLFSRGKAEPTPATSPAPAEPPPKVRLLEIPKTRLKLMQQRILKEVISLAPAHAACHSFRPGRGILSFVQPHVGQEMILRFDLKDFFPSITARRLRAIFRSMGYPGDVAHAFTGLCTNITPNEVLYARPGYSSKPDEWQALRPFRERHLPQGAPTSPALANLAAYRLDARLTGLAHQSGLAYTRYADDLAFSGRRRSRSWRIRFTAFVEAIVKDEGFVLNRDKTKVLFPGGRQQLCGVVVNVKPNVLRADFDRLKAILTNCVRTSPATQNRGGHKDFKAHVLGRIANIAQLNPARGAKLKRLFERIRWT